MIKSVLCVPVLKPGGEIFGVLELYKDALQPAFTEKDMDIVNLACSWMGTAIYLNECRVIHKKQQQLNDYLIDLCKCYFTDNIALDKLIDELLVRKPQKLLKIVDFDIFLLRNTQVVF